MDRSGAFISEGTRWHLSVQQPRWSIDATQTAALVTNALGMAIDSRRPGTVIHSDHGVQFGSWAFTERAKASGLLPSMGSIGDRYDCEDHACWQAA
jgi:transposase InsO family protein